MPGGVSPLQPSPSFSCRYSTNEGETWKSFTFSEKPVFVYGLLTEPGEKSTIFTIFGSYKENGHSWLILQVNTSDVLGEHPDPALNAVTEPHPSSLGICLTGTGKKKKPSEGFAHECFITRSGFDCEAAF